MDDLLPVLLSFPPHPALPNQASDQQYDEGIKAQIEAVRKVSGRNLLQVTSSGEHILNVSNELHHVIAHLQILNSSR
jgi:COP9 signalosome complex subunit 3